MSRGGQARNFPLSLPPETWDTFLSRVSELFYVKNGAPHRKRLPAVRPGALADALD
jgi:hypothetical protein